MVRTEYAKTLCTLTRWPICRARHHHHKSYKNCAKRLPHEDAAQSKHKYRTNPWRMPACRSFELGSRHPLVENTVTYKHCRNANALNFKPRIQDGSIHTADCKTPRRVCHTRHMSPRGGQSPVHRPLSVVPQILKLPLFPNFECQYSEYPSFAFECPDARISKMRFPEVLKIDCWMLSVPTC